MGVTGPSRTIIVQPLEEPAAPPSPPEPERERAPEEPDRKPTEAPEREKVPDGSLG